MTVSMSFLIAALLGGLVLVVDLWIKNTSVGTHDTAPITASANGLTPVEPTIDGVIGEGEYAHQLVDETTGMTLSWTVLGQRLFMAMSSPGQGWIAMGLDPDGPIMQGADILMGYVANGETFLEDHWANSPTSHVNDVDAGGTNNIVAFAGSENQAGTVIEFERPILTDDAFDKPLPHKEIFVQIAYAQKDDWKTYHGSKSRNTVTIDFFATGGAQP